MPRDLRDGRGTIEGDVAILALGTGGQEAVECTAVDPSIGLNTRKRSRNICPSTYASIY